MRLVLLAATSVVVLGLVWNLVSAFNANRKVKKEGIARSMSEFLRANPSDLKEIYESLILKVVRTATNKRLQANNWPILHRSSSTRSLSFGFRFWNLWWLRLCRPMLLPRHCPPWMFMSCPYLPWLSTIRRNKSSSRYCSKGGCSPLIAPSRLGLCIARRLARLRLLDQSDSPDYAIYFFLTLVSQDLPSASKFDFPKIFDLAKSSSKGSVLPRVACLTYGLGYGATDSLRDSDHRSSGLVRMGSVESRSTGYVRAVDACTLETAFGRAWARGYECRVVHR